PGSVARVYAADLPNRSPPLVPRLAVLPSRTRGRQRHILDSRPAARRLPCCGDRQLESSSRGGRSLAGSAVPGIHRRPHHEGDTERRPETLDRRPTSDAMKRIAACLLLLATAIGGLRAQSSA